MAKSLIQRCIVCLSVSFASFLVGTDSTECFAQGPGSYYSTTPTLSPYLDLLRNDGGVLPNYQQFVRPRLQLRSSLAEQSRAIERQRRAINTLNRRTLNTSRQTGATTGVRTGFLQYSTFYPALNQQ